MSTSTAVGVQQPDALISDVKRYVIDVGYAKVLIEEFPDGRLLANGSLVERYEHDDSRLPAQVQPAIPQRP